MIIFFKNLLAFWENCLLIFLLNRLENQNVYQPGNNASQIVDCCLWLKEALR